MKNIVHAASPALVIIVLALSAAGCRRSKTISTYAAGHAITAKIAGDHSLTGPPNRAVLASEFGSVTLEESRVRIGEGEWIRIPESVPVKVELSKGRRFVAAGRVSVEETVR